VTRMSTWPVIAAALLGSMVLTRFAANEEFDPLPRSRPSGPGAPSPPGEPSQRLAASRWIRRNHAGRDVSLLEGVWVVTGAGLPLLVLDPGAATVALGAGFTGAYDDLHPDAARKGLRGHLGALRRGEVSPGTLKIVGLCSTAVAGSLVSGRRNVIDIALDTALVAGSANMANLFDLRPGRCLKVVIAMGVPLAGGGFGARGAAAAAGVGASVMVLPADLKGWTMLGDTGANALGALLGHSAAGGTRFFRLAALVVLTAGTLLSERVSFSTVIDNNPFLHAIDQWGRVSAP